MSQADGVRTAVGADYEVYQATSVIPRRRTMYWRTADVSAWGAHRRAIGRQ